MLQLSTALKLLVIFCGDVGVVADRVPVVGMISILTKPAR
jgi:hypothetical protein